MPCHCEAPWGRGNPFSRGEGGRAQRGRKWNAGRNVGCGICIEPTQISPVSKPSHLQHGRLSPAFHFSHKNPYRIFMTASPREKRMRLRRRRNGSFGALRSAQDGKRMEPGTVFCVIARSEATRQSPGTTHRIAPREQILHPEIATAAWVMPPYRGVRNDNRTGKAGG